MRQASVLIINRDNEKLTRAMCAYLDVQTFKDFDVHVVDNGSKDPAPLISMCMSREYRLTLNAGNRSINHIWNDFALTAKSPILLYLNNDIVFTPGYIEETMRVFELEPEVDIVNHSTNNPRYDKVRPFEYKVLPRYMQGWDFAIRRKAYPQIPEKLQFFCGDAFIYDTIYSSGRKGAMVLSTPIIHHTHRTKGVGRARLSERDTKEYRKMGLWDRRPSVNTEYSGVYPTFTEIG